MQHEMVIKGWGFEKIVCNSELYCGKILHLNTGKKFSWHFHKLKDETFYIRRGTVKLLYGYNEDITKATEIVLGPDSSFHIPVGMIHQLIALEETDVFEFSTTHFDSDSYRITKGD